MKQILQFVLIKRFIESILNKIVKLFLLNFIENHPRFNEFLEVNDRILETMLIFLNNDTQLCLAILLFFSLITHYVQFIGRCDMVEDQYNMERVQEIWQLSTKNKLYRQYHNKMRGREVFFKPYRERINQMFQQHDSIEPGDKYEQEIEKNRNYSPHFNNHKRSYSPSPEHYGANAYNPKYLNGPSYNIASTAKKKNKTYYQAKLQKQMHQPVWEHLYSQGMQAQKNLMEAHDLQKNKIDLECTFEPNIKKNSRYVIPPSSNFLQRNQIWQQNKIDKIVKQKEEQVVKGLEDCTFKPKINSYYKLKSNKYSHKNIDKYRGHPYPATTSASRVIKTSKSAVKLSNRVQMDPEDERKKTIASPYRGNEAMNRQEVGKIKNLIRNQLKRIEL